MKNIQTFVFVILLAAITPSVRGKTIVPRQVDSDEQEPSSEEVHRAIQRAGRIPDLHQMPKRLMNGDFVHGEPRLDDNMEDSRNPDESIVPNNQHRGEEDFHVRNGDEDAPIEDGERKDADENVPMEEDERKDVDEDAPIEEDERRDDAEENGPRDFNRDNDEGYRRDMNEEKDEGRIHSSFEFKDPFSGIGKITQYFQRLERMMREIFKQRMIEASLLGNANTTEEDVNIDGNKYHITKSTIKSDDSNATLYVETLSPASNSSTNE